MDFKEVNNIESKRKKIGCLVSSRLFIFFDNLYEYFLSLILFRPVLVFIHKNSNMTDKKTSATATSATKKASVATKKPVTATPAPPKAEVSFSP